MAVGQTPLFFRVDSAVGWVGSPDALAGGHLQWFSEAPWRRRGDGALAGHEIYPLDPYGKLT